MRQRRRTPEDLGEFIRKRTNWMEYLKSLQELAFGGKTLKNGNGVSYVTQPDVKALSLLADIAYGNGEKETTEVIEKIKKQVSQESAAPLRIISTIVSNNWSV